ncbi:MAG: helix-turn-helix domain-containing protein [Planctomycetaceae bacterium]|jgi:predicted DNA-binding transcriptional regulator AlpA|nr:helix-turn-helix domain-containing protein [Planctomycetaceae bacterium]MDA0283313.1 helix-turn-helix domain-containing protein [Planctomycetota bacterium]
MREPQTSMPSIRPTLITDKDVAQMLKISVRHLHRIKSRGDIIQPVKIGKLTRWNLEQVEQWIQSGCQSPEKANNEGERRDG